MQLQSAMIFCAGFGTRLGKHVADRPKPLVKLGNMTMLDRALIQTRSAGVRNHAVNAHYLASQITEHLATESDVLVSVEEPDILDTGGGLKLAANMLVQSDVFTLNPDVIWMDGNPLVCLADAWNGSRMDALLMLVPTTSTLGYNGKGDFRIDDGGYLERCDEDETGLVYGGAQVINLREVVSVRRQVFSLNLVWDILARKKRLFGLVYDGEWIDVGNPEGLAIADQALSSEQSSQ